MHSAVISDASCLIILHEIDALDLLEKTYGTITTTPLVVSEVRFLLPTWLVIKQPRASRDTLQMPSSIDDGEASAIALALELPDSILIVDERTARNYAKRLGLNVTGTLGVIAKAKVDGIIPSIRPYMEAIAATDFRFSSLIEAEVYKRAGEDKA
jgi:predicted nucleic acid-binding protein